MDCLFFYSLLSIILLSRAAIPLSYSQVSILSPKCCVLHLATCVFLTITRCIQGVSYYFFLPAYFPTYFMSSTYPAFKRLMFYYHRSLCSFFPRPFLYYLLHGSHLRSYFSVCVYDGILLLPSSSRWCFALPKHWPPRIYHSGRLAPL